MAGPIPITEKPSNYGQEADTQRAISQAAQYNPATKLGITNEDQPSKKAIPGPTTAQILAPEGGSPTAPQSGVSVAPPLGPQRAGGYGPGSGLAKSVKSAQPFNSRDIQSHYAHLAELPEASDEIKWYASKVNG
jgi:hypothetical protein